MAVVLVTNIKRFIGGSGDTKPTTGVPAGSIFYEVTSGTPNVMAEYIYDGSAWAKKIYPAS